MANLNIYTAQKPPIHRFRLTLSVGAALLFSACGGGSVGDATARATSSIEFKEFHNCAVPSCSTDLIAAFHVDEFYWLSSTIFGEPILPIASSSGGDLEFRLWEPVAKIVRVEQAQSGVIYSQGVDYILNGDNLVIPVGSSIRQVPLSFIVTTMKTDSDYTSELTKENGPLHIGADYQVRQISVSYEPRTLPPAPHIEGNLPSFRDKLKACMPVAITYYGDSVTAGAMATNLSSIPPFQPPFSELVGAYLSKLCPGEIFWRNEGVSGTASPQGLALAKSNSAGTASDLVVIAYGLNDAVTPNQKADFKANLLGMIETIRYNSPSTEFLLISGILANPDWLFTNISSFAGYRDAMDELSQQFSGVAVVDVTDPWAALLSRKSYYDVTANGVNHPGDFGHLLYAQLIINALTGTP